MVHERFLKPSFLFKYTSKCCEVPNLITIASAHPLFDSNIHSSDDDILIQVFLPLLFQVLVPKLVPHLTSNFSSRYSFNIHQFIDWIIMTGVIFVISSFNPTAFFGSSFSSYFTLPQVYDQVLFPVLIQVLIDR